MTQQQPPRTLHTVNSVCVFCGSRAGARNDYVAAARALGTELAQRGLTLIYGGGHVGLMGELADAALAANGAVVGVIPEHLMQPEVAHQDLTELIVVESMHARKRIMVERADLFIVLPGGFGSLDELFEVLTWRQLRLHLKPIGLANVAGYFDALLALLRHARDEQFIRPEHVDLLLVDADVARLLARSIAAAAQVPSQRAPEVTINKA